MDIGDTVGSLPMATMTVSDLCSACEPMRRMLSFWMSPYSCGFHMVQSPVHGFSSLLLCCNFISTNNGNNDDNVIPLLSTDSQWRNLRMLGM